MKYFFFFFLLHSIMFCQYSSREFDIIINNLNISDPIKENNFNILLNKHFKNKNFDSLVNDTYMLMRWYNKRKQYDKAISLNKRNIYLMDSIKYSDKLFYRQNLYSLAVYLRKNNQINQSVKYYKKVLEYEIDDKYMLYASYQLGLYFFNKEDYIVAKDYFNITQNIANDLKKFDYRADATMYIALCYRLIGDEKSILHSIDLLKKEINSKTIKDNDKRKNSDELNGGLASLYRQLGTNYTDKKNHEYKKALNSFNLALEYTNRLETANKNLRLAYIYHDMGTLYSYENDTIAFTYFDKALSYSSDQLLQIHLYDNKANLYKRLKKFNKAKINNQLALKKLSPNLSEDYIILNKVEDYLNSSQKYLTIETLINKAEIFIAEANYNKTNSQFLNSRALEILKVTEKVLDAVRLDNFEFKTKLFWRNKASRLYTIAIKACYALQDYDKAFYFMEKNKALLLLEDVLLEGQRNSANIPKEITETHDKLRSEVIKYESANDSLLRQKLVAKANYNKFIDSLDSKYKLYFKSIKPAEVISLDSFQNNLKGTNQAYMEYIIGEKEGFGMLVTKEEVELFPILEVDSLRIQIKAFKTFLNKPITNNEDKKKYNGISHFIYNSLFPEQIRPVLEGKSMTIIPDDVLLSIPFEALQTSTADNDYLIYSHQISYANSLTFLSQNSKAERQHTNNAIGFAPIQFSSDLPSLENSKTELEQLNLFEGAKLLIGDKATKQNLVQNLNDYKLIHIATHASSDKFREPYLALNDSLININELYLTKNSADLVVLSACETAKGELYKGEGVLSLSRSFFNTGAKAVTSTLWSIDDQSSSEIMASFYNYLNDGQSKSEALHQAKLDYLDSHALSETSPYYWASFVLVGNPGPIEFSRDYTLYVVLLGLVVLSVLLYLLRKRNKSVA